MDLTKFIRTVPDFPEPGVMFRDVTTLFAEPLAFSEMVRNFSEDWKQLNIDFVAGIDARGFIIGSVFAYENRIGFVPVRKKGKLPFSTISESYELEYGHATLELHTDAVPAGSNVLIMDDLIATGGTAIATVNLLMQLKANVVGCAFLVDLPDLGGAGRLRARGLEVKSLCSFPGQ